MSEELDMEALGREWRKIDMKTIEMALETGKLRGKFTWSFVLMTALALILGYMMISLALQTTRPWSDRMPGLVFVGVCTVAYLWFFRRQWRVVQAADALLTRTPIDLIHGRQALLEAELYALDSRFVRFWELLVAPGWILFATILWWLGNVPVWAPLVVAIPLAFQIAYGRLRRIPRLRAEIAQLEELARTLA